MKINLFLFFHVGTIASGVRERMSHDEQEVPKSGKQHVATNAGANRVEKLQLPEAILRSVQTAEDYLHFRAGEENLRPLAHKAPRVYFRAHVVM